MAKKSFSDPTRQGRFLFGESVDALRCIHQNSESWESTAEWNQEERRRFPYESSSTAAAEQIMLAKPVISIWLRNSKMNIIGFPVRDLAISFRSSLGCVEDG